MKNVAKSGPIIGILTLERTPQKTPLPHYREMTALGAKLGLLVYAFAPQDVDWKRGVVRGFRALEVHGAWHRGPFPLPHFIYDQTKSRRLARSAACRATKARLTAGGTILLGPGFLSKGQVSAILRRSPALEAHLPETLAATAPNVQGLLRRHHSVYLKHANGTLGFNVVRLSRSPRGGYLWEAARGYRHTVRLHLPGPESLRRRLGFTRRGSWLAQQGIDLCRYHGRLADIRLLMQKDENGKWQLTTAFAKVAAPGQVVTNIGAGGSLRGLEELLRAARQHHGWDASPLELRQRLFHVGALTAQTLDKAIGPLAELGIDVGLDTQGHVWLIEANGKYSRKVFSRTIRHLTIRRVFAYARYLYQQRGREPEKHPVETAESGTDTTTDSQVVELASSAL